MMCLSIVPKQFWTNPKNLGRSKTFLDMDQIAKFSREKLFFRSNPKQFGQIQNHLGPIEG